MDGFLRGRFERHSRVELAKQLDTYRNLYEKSQQELIQLKSASNYVQLTQDMREFLQRYKTDTAHFSQILLKNFEKNHFFIIDAGSHKGITKDMIAVYKDCLLGKVTEVYPYYSKVVLITDPGCKVAACCVSNNVKGIHEGILHETTKLSFVNHLENLKEGDLVISSGEGLIFPRGFGLGKIKRWERDGYTCLVDIEPLIDFKKIDYCTLLENSTELIEQSKQTETHTQALAVSE